MPNAAAELFEKHINSLYAFAKKRVQNEEDILDLLQDTFLAYIESADRFKQLSVPLTYLTGILRNLIFNLYRKQNREISVADDDLGLMLQQSAERSHTKSLDSSIVQALEAREMQTAIERCVHKLPSLYYEAFIMREIEELPTEEICKILKITVTNLNVILHRARQKLRQMLLNEGIHYES